MRDVCQDDTGGVSGGYGNVECRRGSSSTMMHRVTCTQTHGHMKVDDDDARVRMSKCGKHVEMGNLDVFSARCNSGVSSMVGVHRHVVGAVMPMLRGVRGASATWHA